MTNRNEYDRLVDVEQTSYDDTAASTDESSSEQEAEGVNGGGEISEPWPATFGRSAKILARPIVGLEEVVRATESIHILPPTKLRKNVSHRRIFYTYVCAYLSSFRYETHGSLRVRSHIELMRGLR